MNELNTIIVNRNDSSENWATEAGQATPLKPGEFAVEIENGKAKLKIGTSEDSTFGNSAYFGGSEAKVYTSDLISGSVTDDDIDIIEELVGENEVNAGDMAIVRRYLTGTSGAVSYTSYVYDPTVASDVKWIAMDGNYSASNVFFKNDITLAGDYTSVGNVKLTDNTLEAAGQSVEDLFTNIFTKELKENLKTGNPTASISSFTEYIEVGSSGTKSTTVSLNGDGEYKYGYSTDPEEPTEGQVVTSIKNDKSTGVVVDTSKTNPYSVTFNGKTVESASATFTLEAPVKKEKAELTATGKVYYTEGGVPVSNLKKAYPAQRIAAGQATSSASSKFRWYIPYYQGFIYGADNKLSAVDVSKLTIVTGSTAYNASNPKTDTATKSWIQYWLVAPASYNWTMNEAKDSNGLTLDVDTTQPNIKITYGSGDDAVEVEYKVLVISHKAPYGTLGISWK